MAIKIISHNTPYNKIMKNILYIFTFGIILILTACSKNASKEKLLIFTEKVHNTDNIISGNFKMLSTYTEEAEYYFKSSTTEIEAAEYINQMEENIKILQQLLKQENKLNIYIIDDLAIEEAYCVENNLIMSTEMFKQKNYLSALVSTYYESREQWIIKGIEELLFNGKPDMIGLTSYYSDLDNMSTLGLFGGRFYEFFCTEEEVEIAKDTAASLINYIIEYYGYEKLTSLIQDPSSEESILGIDYATLKNAWLSSINVDNIYEYPYEGEFVGMQFSLSSNYPVVISTEEVAFCFTPNSMPLHDINNIEDIETFFHYSLEGQELIRNYLLEQASGKLNYINLSEDIICKIYSMDTKSLGGSNNIILTAGNTYLHELVHIYVPTKKDNQNWLYEGVAEYLGRILFPSYWKTVCYQSLKQIIDSPESLLEINKEVYDSSIKLINTYIAMGGQYNSFEQFKPIYFYDADALLINSTATDYITSSFTMSETYPYNTTGDGLDLSYTQCGSLVAYLVDHYSFENVISVCEDYSSFERVFGKTFDEIRLEWDEYLTSNYNIE